MAEKNKQLENRDNEISLLTNENQKLKAINQEKDQQLAKYKEKLNKIKLLVNKIASPGDLDEICENLFGETPDEAFDKGAHYGEACLAETIREIING